MASFAPFFKLVHVFFIILWIGSLLTLSRLMSKASHSDAKEQYKKVYFTLDLPSMIIAIIFGIILLFNVPINFKAGWFHAKMTGAIGLILCDIWLLGGFMCPKRAKKRFSPIHFVITCLVLLLTLSAIYLMRNKEKEWCEKYQVAYQIPQGKIVK